MAKEGFRLASGGIKKVGKLLIKYTSEWQIAHESLSPPIEWYNVPKGTKSLALTVQDIDEDRPRLPLVHWLVINIPPTLNGLPQGFSGKKEEELVGDYAGVKEEINWRGPELAANGHRFKFKIYALDGNIHLGNQVTNEKLLEEIQGHVLGEAALTGITELSPQDKDNAPPFTVFAPI
ncbi:hypothetical protein ACHQM5_001076 [Ranunculus cassubicifolius]